MRYFNAKDILPKELVEKLQDYVQGEYLYIPAIKEQHKNWGELSGFREEIDRRNSEIIHAYASGNSIQELAESYYLSVYAIRKSFTTNKNKYTTLSEDDPCTRTGSFFLMSGDTNHSICYLFNYGIF